MAGSTYLNIKVMQKIFVAAAIGFSLFLGSIIYIENTGGGVPAIGFIRSLSHGDKAAHFMLFGLMSFLLNLALAGACFKWRRWAIYRGSALVGVFTVLEECSQRFVATRTFDYFDLLADILGIALFAIVTASYLKKSRQKRVDPTASE